MDRHERATRFTRAVIARLREENVTFMAGSIAYEAFISLAPLLILTVFVVSLLGGEEATERVVTHLDRFVAPNVAPLLRSIFRIHPGLVPSLTGVVTLVWGSFRVFRALNTAFSEIYDTHGENTLRSQVADAAVAIVALLGALFASMLAATAVAALALPYDSILTTVLLAGILFVAFLPMYWRFPDAGLSLRAVVPGVVVAVVGWAALQVVFEVYVAVVGRLDAASVLGAVLLLLLWLYLDSVVLLTGAIINAVVADRSDGRPAEATG